MRKISFVLAALLLLAGSCTSPLASLKTAGSTPVPAIGANESRLVFHFSQGRTVNYAYNLSNIGYLVVQLHSTSQQSTKFATAPVSGGTAIVSFTGLVAGDWDLSASCYDWDGGTIGGSWTASAEPQLLYSASGKVAVSPGQSSNVPLLLYKPGDISGVTLTEARFVDHATLSATASHVLAGSARFQVFASAKDASENPAAIDQRFTWTSDNPDVAVVDTIGWVTPKNPGKARITATTVVGNAAGDKVSASFDLNVDPAVVGYWKYDNGASMGYRILNITNGTTGLQVRYLTDVNSTSMSPSHYISPLTLTADKTWQFSTSTRFDFTTGTETTMAGGSMTIQWTSQDQITLIDAPNKVFSRVTNVTPVSGINLPSSSVKTGQTLTAADVVSPIDATVSQVYFTSTDNTRAMPMNMNSRLNFQNSSPPDVTVTVRSIDDPTKFATRSYTVLAAATQPTAFQIILATSTALQLTWSYAGIDGLVGVDVYRSPDGTSWTKLNGSPVGVGLWDDTGLTPGTNYFYHLVATGGTGTSLAVYLDSVPTETISAYTLGSGEVPVLVSGPNFDPGNLGPIDRGDGVQIPYRMMTGNYGSQFFASNDGTTYATNNTWFRGGEYTWFIYSLPLAGATNQTLVTRWDHLHNYMSEVQLAGVSRVWQVDTSNFPGYAILRGSGASSANLYWSPGTLAFSMTPP